jgi:hypothetical protein
MQAKDLRIVPKSSLEGASDSAESMLKACYTL